MFVVLLILYCTNLVSSDVTIAMTDFETFLQTELETVEILKNFSESEMQRIMKLQKDIETYKNTIVNGILYGIDNPVQFYSVLKNVTLHWSAINSFNVTNDDSTFNESILVYDTITAPLEKDLRMGRIALVRLQSIYKLSHIDIINGNIMGMPKAETPLNANDCLQLGMIFFDKMDYNNSVLWMEQALKLLQNENTYPSVNKTDILKHYAYALYKQGREEKSLEVLVDFFKLYGSYDSLYDYITSDSMDRSEVKESMNLESIDSPLSGLRTGCDFYNCTDDYKSLCNGELNNERYIDPSLNCYYKMDRPYLRLAPLKVEIVNRNPDVFYFRQVIADHEIQTVKNLAKNKLSRAKVGGGKETDIRITKIAWLYNNESNVLDIINKRLEDMTNLNLTTAEPLQVAQYGLGGHYDVHYDAFGHGINDRIATLILYFTSPTAGGATVFPLAKVATFPQKNDAVFWYNILKNGTKDSFTLHGGCPVLSGKKWIANKWIHSYGQEFIRPCSLEQKE